MMFPYQKREALKDKPLAKGGAMLLAVGVLLSFSTVQATELFQRIECQAPVNFEKLMKRAKADTSKVRNMASCSAAEEVSSDRIEVTRYSGELREIKDSQKFHQIERAMAGFPQQVKGLFYQYFEDVTELDQFFSLSKKPEEACFSSEETSELRQIFDFHQKILLQILPASLEAVQSSFTLDLTGDDMAFVQKLRGELNRANMNACYDKALEVEVLQGDLQTQLNKVAQKLQELESFKVSLKEDRFLAKDHLSAQLPDHPESVNRNDGLFRSFQKLIGGVRDFFTSSERNYILDDRYTQYDPEVRGDPINLDREQRTARNLNFDTTIGGIRISDFLKAKDDESQFRANVENFDREANYWLEVSRDVSGVRTDVWDKKMQHTSNVIDKINTEMKQSLEAIDIICRSQSSSVPCVK